jgi:hypothetical protein
LREGLREGLRKRLREILREGDGGRERESRKSLTKRKELK